MQFSHTGASDDQDPDLVLDSDVIIAATDDDVAIVELIFSDTFENLAP